VTGDEIVVGQPFEMQVDLSGARAATLDYDDQPVARVAAETAASTAST
jgi:hypothetical protein